MKNEYEVRGDNVAIFLNRKDGTMLETLISVSDFEKVDSFPNTWYPITFKKHPSTFYVQGYFKSNGKNTPKLLHRWLLDEPKGLVVDHINHDTLNNTRENLRVITQGQNCQNRKGPQINSTTDIRGVSFVKHFKKYKAHMQLNGKTITIGYFHDIKEAEKAVIKARERFMPFSKDAAFGEP